MKTLNPKAAKRLKQDKEIPSLKLDTGNVSTQHYTWLEYSDKIIKKMPSFWHQASCNERMTAELMLDEMLRAILHGRVILTKTKTDPQKEYQR